MNGSKVGPEKYREFITKPWGGFVSSVFRPLPLEQAGREWGLEQAKDVISGESRTRRSCRGPDQQTTIFRYASISAGVYVCLSSIPEGASAGRMYGEVSCFQSLHGSANEAS